MNMTSALLLVATSVHSRLCQAVAAAKDRRGRVALWAALILPSFSGQGGTVLPTIAQQPASPVGLLVGEALNLKVESAGAAPLTYQWRTNNVNLADGGTISGSATSNLVIRPAFTNNSGSYTVVVANASGVVTSRVSVVTVSLDKTPPKVAITFPAPGTRTNAGVTVTFGGTASDNVLVTNVSYWVTNLNGLDSASPAQGQAVLTAGSGPVSNWTASVVAPAGGSNILVVQSQDFSGNPSSLETLKFFVKTPTLLALATNGYGKVKGTSSIRGDAPPTNGALLNVGEAYALTATPALNNYLAGWSGTSLTAFGASNGLTLNFIMESNTAITANFITNRFVGMAGIYNGLFSSAEIGTNTEETAGMISGLTLNTRGVYSATVLLGGEGRGISGTFTPEGYATNTLLVSNVPDGNVTVELSCDGTNTPRTIHGWVIGTNTILLPNGTEQAGWQSEAALVASLTNTSNFPGAYTLLIPPASNAIGTNVPTGCGYVALTNTLRAGGVPAAVRLTGLLPDWASIVTVIPIGEDNAMPIYLNYYNTPQPGMLFGMLTLASNAPYVPSGYLTWIRKASSIGLFTNGFTNNYPFVEVSPWSNAVRLSNIITTHQLVLADGGLTAPLTYAVTVSGTNLVLAQSGASTNHASGSVNTNTGKLTITFTNDLKVKVIGQGALLQNTNGSANLGGGFFIVGPAATPTNSGSISWQLPSP